MTPQVRNLIASVVYGGNMTRQTMNDIQAILDGDKTDKDKAFRESIRSRMERTKDDTRRQIAGLATVEEIPEFNPARFLLTPADHRAARTVIDALRVAAKLEHWGIRYAPAILLHGATGCGKTTLARYIAHEAGLPFVLLNLNNITDSLLGQTEKNISKVFAYAAQEPCVLCLDEIDVFAIRRGTEDGTGAISRACISLMQNLDRMPNTSIIVGTTNRFDDLDPAFVRRFQVEHKVLPLSSEDAGFLRDMFFDSTTGISPDDLVWPDGTPAYQVINQCTARLIDELSKNAG